MRKKPAPPPKKRSQAKDISVMAWIENHFGEILLLKQKRGNALWTLPGGKVNKRETLEAALRRELLEETALKAASAVLISIFERPEKGNITFLFRVSIKGSDIIYPRPGEIETALFSSSLPEECTPSLTYFWKVLHENSSDLRLPGER